MGPPKPGLVSRFKDCFERFLGPNDALSVMVAYNITDSASEEEATMGIWKFGNDINFLAPVLVYAHGWDQDAYIYFFNEPNEWEGPWKGYANHILDVAYLFQNYNEALTEHQRETANTFGKDLIQFANAQSPWPVFNFAAKDLNAKVYGAKDLQQARARVEIIPGPNSRSERRQTIFQLSLSVPLTILSAAWGSFMSGN
jgi:carboxylesterase type B